MEETKYFYCSQHLTCVSTEITYLTRNLFTTFTSVIQKLYKILIVMFMEHSYNFINI